MIVRLLALVGIVLVILGVLALVGLWHIGASAGALLGVGIVLLVISWFLSGGYRRAPL